MQLTHILSEYLPIASDLLAASGDVYYRTSSGLGRLPIGASGQVMRVVSGAPNWGAVGFDIPQYKWETFTDFESASAPGVFTSATNGGAGAGAGQALEFSDVNRVGFVNLDSGATATGAVTMNTGAGSIRLGGGIFTLEAAAQVWMLSNDTEKAAHRLGLKDDFYTDPTDGVWFEYDSTISKDWLICTAASGIRTRAGTFKEVIAQQWYKFEIVINADASQANFYIDSVFVGSIATNIPSGSGREVGIGFSVTRTSGVLSTSRIVLDYVYANYIFTNPRT